MTVPQPSTPPPPGWYPDPSGSGQLRWWDGTAWTETAWTPPAQPGAAPFGAPPPGQFAGPPRPAPRPEISGQTPVYNPFIWLVTLLPLIPLAILLAWNPAFHLRYIGARRVPAFDPASMFSVPYFLLIAAGWLVYGVTVFLAYLDWQKLGRDGVLRPFHWAWAFLGAGVYVVGRSVIVHKVAPQRGLAPVWALIGVAALSVILVGFKVGLVFSSVARNLPM